MLFKTNGVREVVGERLTPPFAVALVRAVAQVSPEGRPIAIGRDARTSSAALADLFGATLLLDGRDVIDLGLLPTPAAQYDVPRVGAGFGVVITASHNPPSTTVSSVSTSGEGRSPPRSSPASRSCSIKLPWVRRPTTGWESGTRIRLRSNVTFPESFDSWTAKGSPRRRPPWSLIAGTERRRSRVRSSFGDSGVA